MPKKITVYTAPSCPYCVQAKALLTRRGIPFEEIKYGWDEEAKWDELARRTGLSTMPQIFAGDQLIGGYSDLAELDSKDELKSLRS